MDFDLKSVIGAVAPTLAGMLGGPLAMTAVTALEGAFGVPTGSGLDGITKVVQSGAMTPEIISQVRAADQKHAEALAQQGIDVQKLNLAHQEAMAKNDESDRDSARNREVQVKDNTNRILAYTIVGAFIAMVGATLLGFAKVESVLAGTLVGYLSAKAELVISYYFGSSSDSARQSELLARAPAIDK